MSRVPITYVGSHGRIGLGVDQDGNVSGEILGVFGRSGVRAFLAEAYHVDGGGSGAKFGYNWLWGGASLLDTRERPQTVTVAKLFGAVDRNDFGDRKATIGLGFEREAGELDLYYSRNLTDERLLAGNLVSESRFRLFEQDGRQFRQLITTDTITNTFEHPYEHGLGFRLGRFFEGAQLRLRGGLDYERGSALLQNSHASQTGATLGAEKFFSDSQHSLALEVGHHRKDGPFDKPQFGGKREDTRATLTWRYDLGKAYRPVQEYRDAEAPAPAAAAPQIVRNEVEMSSQELFEFDRAELTDTARAKLGGLLDALKNKRAGEVRIVGHTCDLGTDAYNQALSERRAEAVRTWLIAQGVPADAIDAEGAGEASPRYPNDSEDNRAKNRRIELSFLSVEETRVEAPAQAEIKREPVPTAAPWIERALHNLPAHKREVDTYRVQRVQTRVQEGPIEEIGNRAPVADADTANTPANTAVNIAVLANDADPDGDALTVQQTLVVLPANGSAAVNSDGTITYTPAAGFAGEDNFTYQVSDGRGGTDVAAVTVTVAVAAPANAPPVAQPDTELTNGTLPVLINVLGNDSDSDGPPPKVQSVATPTVGTAVINQDGTITYTPVGGAAFVSAQFDYTIVDEDGATATATVQIFRSNVSPVAVNDPADFGSGGGFNMILGQGVLSIDVLANDFDLDLDPLTITGVGAITGAPGTVLPAVTVAADGKSVAFNPGSAGAFTFQYEITDGRGLTDVGVVRVNVSPTPPSFGPGQ